MYRGRPVTPGCSEVVANVGVRGWQGVPVRGVSGAMEQLWFLSATKEDRDGHGVLARAAELVSIPTCPGGGTSWPASNQGMHSSDTKFIF